MNTELDLRKLVTGILQERIAPMAKAGAGYFVRLRSLAENDEKQNVFLVKRVEQLETWRNRIKVALPVFSALFGPKRV